MIFCLFFIIKLLIAIKVEFEVTKDTCDRRLIKKLILEKYDIFAGYSEEIISKRFLEEDDYFLEIKDEYFKDNSLIRFKVSGWNKKSNIYASDFFIGKSIVDFSHIKTLLRFYASVKIIMNNDESFKKEIIEDCIEKDPGPIIPGCYYKFIFYKKLFININKQIRSFKGDEFELFKLVCVALFKEIPSVDDISGLISNFNKKTPSDIFFISKRIIKIMNELNEYMKFSKVIEKYSEDERYYHSNYNFKIRSETLNCIEIEFKLYDCGPRSSKQTIIKESFDLSKGLTECIISKTLNFDDNPSIEIDDKYFDDTSIQRFKLFNWQKSSFIYSSEYFVGKNIIDSKHIQVFIKLYYKMYLIMNQDKEFKNKLSDDLKKVVPYDIWIWEKDKRYIIILEDLLNKTEYICKKTSNECLELLKDMINRSMKILFIRQSIDEIYEMIRMSSLLDLYTYKRKTFYRLDFLHRIICQSDFLSDYCSEKTRNLCRKRQYKSN